MRNKLFIIGLSFLALAALFVYDQARFFDGKLHVVFCDVGQGDAIFIRSPTGADILIDGGPDKKVLDCLFSHMPFWDRSIELMLLSHPHQDHLAGLIEILKRYDVSSFATEKLTNDTGGFRLLMQTISDHNVPIQYVYQNDSYYIEDNLRLRVLHPTKEFLQQTAKQGKIDEGAEFASLVLLLSYGQFDVLMTGDSQKEGFKDALSFTTSGLSIEVLQIPHHGSKTGIDQEILDRVNASLAVLSVGRKNRYKHPHPSILSLLEKNRVKVKRTDQEGEIEIVTDGKEIKIQKSKIPFRA